MSSTDPLPARETAASAPGHPAPSDADGSSGAPAEAPGATAVAAAPGMTPADCGQRLRQLWPALFAGGAKPIKLRIQKDIQARSPGAFTRPVLSAFLHRHTGSTSYLLAIARGGARFDLDGQAAGEISEEHRIAATQELARRRASREAREALELEQRRNRAGLLRDFERTTLSRANFCALKGVAEDELDRLLAVAREEAVHAPLPRDRVPDHGPRDRGPRDKGPRHGPRR